MPLKQRCAITKQNKMQELKMLKPNDLPQTDPGLEVTASALNHIRRSLAEGASAQKPTGILLHVKKAGCSGYEYELKYAFPHEQIVLDFIFVYDDVTVLIGKEIYLKF